MLCMAPTVAPCWCAFIRPRALIPLLTICFTGHLQWKKGNGYLSTHRRIVVGLEEVQLLIYQADRHP